MLHANTFLKHESHHLSLILFGSQISDNLRIRGLTSFLKFSKLYVQFIWLFTGFI